MQFNKQGVNKILDQQNTLATSAKCGALSIVDKR